MTRQEAIALSNLPPISTWDKHTNKRIETLHPIIRNLVAQAINDCETKGFKVRVTGDGCLRTWDEQNQLYGHSRTREQLIAKGINPDYAKPNETWKTNATGGESWHNFGLAIDICMIVNNNAVFVPDKVVVDIFKSYGFAWGGDWKKKDNPHFEITFGFSLANMQAKYKAHEIDMYGYVKLTA